MMIQKVIVVKEEVTRLELSRRLRTGSLYRAKKLIVTSWVEEDKRRVYLYGPSPLKRGEQRKKTYDSWEVVNWMHEIGADWVEVV